MGNIPVTRHAPGGREMAAAEPEVSEMPVLPPSGLVSPGSVWFDAMGDIVTPLLAGFAVTTLIVVSDDASKLRWPGAAILVLAIAATVLVVAVQCAYHGRAWFNEATARGRAGNRDEWQAEVWKVRDPRQLGHFFAQWTRRTFKFGLVALLAGLALAIFPQHGSGREVDLRWAASSIIFAACFCEAAWIVGQWGLSLYRQRRKGSERKGSSQSYSYQSYWWLPKEDK